MNTCSLKLINFVRVRINFYEGTFQKYCMWSRDLRFEWKTKGVNFWICIETKREWIGWCLISCMQWVRRQFDNVAFGSNLYIPHMIWLKRFQYFSVPRINKGYLDVYFFMCTELSDWSSMWQASLWHNRGCFVLPIICLSKWVIWHHYCNCD